MSTEASSEFRERAFQRRAIEVAIWGMPIVSVDAMRRGFFGVGAQYNDIVYFSKPADWQFRVTTPNSSSLYVLFFFNLKSGPIVLDLPAAEGDAGLAGSLLDAWQVQVADVGLTGEDLGKGGKYLLLPPGFMGESSPDFIPLRFKTYNGYGAFRAIPQTRSDEDLAKALALVKKLHLYRQESSAQQRFIDIHGQLFDGIVKFDDSFYSSLANMVNEEPIQTRDMVAMGQLHSIGIEKEKEFKPDTMSKEILKEAIAEAHSGLMEEAMNLVPYWPGAKWGLNTSAALGAKTRFSYQAENFLDIDGRGTNFFMGCALPKKLGAATLYLVSGADGNDALFDGGKSYQLHVPPNVPAKRFWAVTVYDLESAAFIQKSPKTEVNSHQDLQKNEDGSVDVYFGPNAPNGKESNWIYTAADKRWFAVIRFYGPEEAINDKTWTMGDIEEM